MLVALYSKLLENWPYSEHILFTVTLSGLHATLFFFVNILLYLCQKYHWLEQYKIQNKNPAPKLVWKCIKENIMNSLGSFILFAYYPLYPGYKYFGMKTEVSEIPPWSTIIFQIIISFLIMDFLFYCVHRALHNPVLYNNIHIKHHQFVHTIGFAAEYAHPVEQVFANAFTTMIGPMILGSHLFTLLVFMFIRILETIDAHCGYKFPFSPFEWIPVLGGVERHDYHHSHACDNFGIFVFWDTLFRTDKSYLKWVADGKPEK